MDLGKRQKVIEVPVEAPEELPEEPSRPAKEPHEEPVPAGDHLVKEEGVAKH